MAGSQKRAYGKGGTASSRAVLNDLFLDENDINEQMSSLSLGQAGAHLSSKEDDEPVPAVTNPVPVIPVARKGKGAESDPGVEPSAVTFTLPLRTEGHKLKGLRDFSAWADKVAAAFMVVKVGEGSYGEVFKLESRTQQSQIAGRDSILKLVPLRSKGNQSNSHMSLNALIHEVQMLKLMDPIPGFTRFRDLTVLQGPYPPSFTDTFNEYKAVEANDSRSDLPSRYPDKQLWVLIEMDDGGRDLETLKAPSIYQIFDIFWLICCSLSYAEEQVEFEHRDLHVGNICIRSNHPNDSLDIFPELNKTMTPETLRKSHFGYSGLRTTIIDYTLSRGTRPNPQYTNNPETIYDDFRTAPGIFKGLGKDPEETRQRATYRSMRDHALLTSAKSIKDDPSRENKKLNPWARFLPRTNVLWLDYLLFVLLYRCQEGGRQVLEGSSEAALELQERLRVRLVRVWNLMRGKGEWDGSKGLGSAREVVERAREEGLLGEEDLEAIRAVLGREE